MRDEDGRAIHYYSLYTILTIHHSYLEEARDEDERGSHQDGDELLGADPRQQRHHVDEQEAAADVCPHEDGAGQGHGLALHRTNLAHLPVVGRVLISGCNARYGPGLDHLAVVVGGKRVGVARVDEHTRVDLAE